MDYEVFLLSRIREEYLRTGDNASSVADGLAATARVITAAAAIMMAVFGAFVLSDQVFLKLIGTGLAAAILVDATIVRMILVPASMQLLGDRNWWLPDWLDRRLPKLSIEAHPTPASDNPPTQPPAPAQAAASETAMAHEHDLTGWAMHAPPPAAHAMSMTTQAVERDPRRHRGVNAVR
jgi:RND superfamily putative drug exporter